jgi:hypothetical protein
MFFRHRAAPTAISSYSLKKQSRGILRETMRAIGAPCTAGARASRQFPHVCRETVGTFASRSGLARARAAVPGGRPGCARASFVFARFLDNCKGRIRRYTSAKHRPRSALYENTRASRVAMARATAECARRELPRRRHTSGQQRSGAKAAAGECMPRAYGEGTDAPAKRKRQLSGDSRGRSTLFLLSLTHTYTPRSAVLLSSARSWDRTEIAPHSQ